MCRTKARAADTGHYRCRVTDEKGTILFTQPATVSLVHQGERDGGGDITDRSLKQLDQWKGAYSSVHTAVVISWFNFYPAEKILQTLDGKRYGKTFILCHNKLSHALGFLLQHVARWHL